METAKKVTKADVQAAHQDDFTVPELARLLKLRPEAVRKMLVWKEIEPAYRIGRQWRIPASTVAQFYRLVTQTPLG